MGLFRKQPFILPLIPLALLLIVLSSVTKRQACWVNPNAFWFSGIANDCPAICADADKDTINQQTTPTMGGRAFKYFVEDTTLDSRIAARCPWKSTTGRLFIASACAMFVWAVIETLLVVKRRFYLPLNIILLLVLGLGIGTAAKQLDDLHYLKCEEIETLATSTRMPANLRGGECDKSLFTVSFILQVIACVLCFFQIVYNIFRRSRINEKDVEYHNVPQNPTTEGHAPMTEGNAPVTEPQVSAENRIAS